MASAEAAADMSGPRYAPDDPTLPSPWKGLIDGSTGVMYYWNPDTNITQYERPAAAAPPLPAGLPPSVSIPNLAPIPSAQTTAQSSGITQQTSTHMGTTGQPVQQEQPSQAVYAQLNQPQFNQQVPLQQMPYQQQQLPNQQIPQQQQYPNMHLQQMPYQQPVPYMQGQQHQQQGMQYPYQFGQQPQMSQAAYNQGQQPQMAQATYNQGQQQQQGMRPPLNQLQQQQQPQNLNQQVQVPQIPHSQGLHMNSQPFQFSNQQGQQLHPSHPGPQQGHLSPGSQGSFPKGDETTGQDGKHASVSVPFSQQTGPARLNQQFTPNQRAPPVVSSQPNLSPSGGSSFPPKQQFGGSSPHDVNNINFTSPSGQIRPAGMEANFRHPQSTGPVVPHHPGPSPVRPPMGFRMGDHEDLIERMGSDLYSSTRVEGPSMPPQQPKLAALPPIQNRADMRNGPPFAPPGPLGGYNMAPPHSMPNFYKEGAFPNTAPVRPSARLFTPSDFPSISAAADAYRRQHEVTATGENVPAPFMTFRETGFPPEILRELELAGFLTPTPIQAQTWPVALDKRDIVAIAKTGSGKTLGYLIPAFIHLMSCRNNPMMGPTVLVLAPTRELASQIQEEAIKFGRSSRISCTCLYGGAPKGPQIRELERGADIVVATPGRLNDILEMRKISFRQVSLLVLDEADRMLDMGFEPQIRKIVNEIPPNRQTLMYTATWPKEVRKIAGDLLRNPVQVNIGSVDELSANKNITQYVEVVAPMNKQRRLEQILRAEERGSKIIIFCSTKKQCDQLARSIRGLGAAAIHGDKSQPERDHVLNQFRTGRTPILVATDVAARGLDIKDIRVVINYDFPTGIQDYVHRIGRTGRAGATGVAYTFFSDQDSKHAPDLVRCLEGGNQRIPPELQQIASRSGPLVPRNQGGGMSRWDASGGGRFEPGGGGHEAMRDGPGSFGGRGDNGHNGFRGRGGRGPAGFGGRGGAPVGFGGRGGRGDSPGFGGRGGGRADFYGGQGARGRGFQGPRGPMGRGRLDRSPQDRYLSSDGRGRNDDRRGFGDRIRDRSYSRSPNRSRSRGYDRRVDSRSPSRSRGRSRSRSRSWSPSRSPSRSWSRSRSGSYDRYHGDGPEGAEFQPRPRKSGFDVLPVLPTEPAALPQPQMVEQPALLHPGEMSPMSPGRENGLLRGNDNVQAGQLEGPGGVAPSFSEPVTMPNPDQHASP